jgi:hypothetical protein
MTVTFTNGSQLIFFGENYDKDKELNRFRGLEVNGFLLEEINELQEQTYFKAIERAGSYIIPNATKQPPPVMMGTCNPTQGWVKERFYTPYKEGTLADNILYIQSKIFDNPFISEDYKESLKSLPRYEYEVFVNGDWDIQLKQGNEFFRSFEISQHVNSIRANKDATIHISVDSNVFPYIAVSIWQIDKDDDTGAYIAKKIHEMPCKDPDNTARKSGQKAVRWLKDEGFTEKER